MMQYELSVLAIQEHTPWSRELSDAEINGIQRYCNYWGFGVIISKVQILITDKQLTACIRESKIHEEGRIIHTKMEISQDKFVNFISTYGYPHSPNNRNYNINNIGDENAILQGMRRVRNTLKSICNKVKNAHELLYIFGDPQDTPDQSNLFYYGSKNIMKHPLGIIQTCEEYGLECTIYQHLETMSKPIISRHGAKGGRFIDGMYTDLQGMQHIQGITIAHDTEIFSDHSLVITKMELGLKKYTISQAKEERVDYRRIMNTPVVTPPGHDHTILNENVFKGTYFREHAKLYNTLQKIANDPALPFKKEIKNIHQQLITFE
jgi:hypothetical protein